MELRDNFMQKSAVLSPCRGYRYELWRVWDKTKPTYVFIGLNPSTADETEDDPTIRKCVAYVCKWGGGALCMVNLFAYRATDPRAMLASYDPIGPDNDATLRKLSSCTYIIAAWGNHGAHLSRAKQVMGIMPTLLCLKQNKDGSPAHPLYLKGDLVPRLFIKPMGCLARYTTN